MDETSFREYERVAQMVICTEICPGMTVEDLFALANNRIKPFPNLPPEPEEAAA
jgi:hypothetical protein